MAVSLYSTIQSGMGNKSKWFIFTAWKVPKYGVFSGPYFPLFGKSMKTMTTKTTNSSGILKTIYHNGGYLLLFEKRRLQNFEIS